MQMKGRSTFIKEKFPIISLLLPFFLFGSVFLSQAANVNTGLNKQLHRYIKNGGYLITKHGRIIASHNPDRFYIPASTFKLATALAALKVLGADYRYTTSFYSDAHSNLYIKGYGDPFLISEEIPVILDKLQEKKISAINNIFLDDSAFAVTSPPEGAGNSLNPYDVANSALAANFNTINFTVTKNGSVQSAEQQTPTLPLMLELGKTLAPGTHRINISIQNENVLRHVGELFRIFQAQEEIPGTGKIKRAKVPKGFTAIYSHRSSKKLSEVIEALMLYSNNYMTNQLYLTMGANEFGYPATWEKGEKSLQLFLATELNLDEKNIKVAEGSGLSRNNRVTPRALLTLLEEFKPNAHLLPLDKGRRIKSGTLTNVYSYAGYFQENGEYDSFVLILNQKGNHRDKVISILEKMYHSAQ